MAIITPSQSEDLSRTHASSSMPLAGLPERSSIPREMTRVAHSGYLLPPDGPGLCLASIQVQEPGAGEG